MTRSSYRVAGAKPYMSQETQRIDCRFVIFGTIVVIAALLISIYANFYAPPCTGTVTGKGYHSKVAGALYGQPGSELVYYIHITDDDGRTWWSWYVDEKTYQKYNEGDRLCFFGKIGEAQVEQKGGTE